MYYERFSYEFLVICRSISLSHISDSYWCCPLYLMYPSGGGQPEVLPQILRESIVLKAIST